jgi:hypothetical protein
VFRISAEIPVQRMRKEINSRASSLAEDILKTY